LIVIGQFLAAYDLRLYCRTDLEAIVGKSIGRLPCDLPLSKIEERCDNLPETDKKKILLKNMSTQ